MNVKNFMSKQSMILAVAVGMFFVSCGNDNTDAADKDELVEVADTIKTAVVNVGGELFSIPSPFQTALLIQKTGISYDKQILHTSSKVNTYNSDFLRAINLGIYGADLGYVSLYSQSQDALSYLASLKQLADKLGVSSAFDAATMQRIEANITNQDSMLVLVGIAYRSSDAFLKNSNRTDVSSLILTGGWLESMHFTISAYNMKQANELKWRIAEQKQALTSLIKILSGYESAEIAGLVAELKDLATVYEGISFKYNFVEPTVDEEKKITYINSTNEVNVTDEQLKQITEKVAAIRGKLVNSTNS
ncbi:MAG: hypothetical protein AB7O73_01775 [Bacteroidia bacterium]